MAQLLQRANDYAALFLHHYKESCSWQRINWLIAVINPYWILWRGVHIQLFFSLTNWYYRTGSESCIPLSRSQQE
jgi:hypothetical protein